MATKIMKQSVIWLLTLSMIFTMGFGSTLQRVYAVEDTNAAESEVQQTDTTEPAAEDTAEKATEGEESITNESLQLEDEDVDDYFFDEETEGTTEQVDNPSENRKAVRLYRRPSRQSFEEFWSMTQSTGSPKYITATVSLRRNTLTAITVPMKLTLPEHTEKCENISVRCVPMNCWS